MLVVSSNKVTHRKAPLILGRIRKQIPNDFLSAMVLSCLFYTWLCFELFNHSTFSSNRYNFCFVYGLFRPKCYCYCYCPWQQFFESTPPRPPMALSHKFIMCFQLVMVSTAALLIVPADNFLL